MIASANPAVPSVHAGTSVLDGRTEADSFHADEAGKLSSGSCCGHSSDEEVDAVLEREEERIMLEDEAEKHMLSVALAQSVADVKGKVATKGRDRAGDQARRDQSQSQMPESLVCDPKAVGISSGGVFPSAVALQGKQSSCGRNGESNFEVSKGPSENPTDVPGLDPKVNASPRRRSRRSSARSSVSQEMKSGEGVWLGTRKRRRELAMKTTQSDGTESVSSSAKSGLDARQQSPTAASKIILLQSQMKREETSDCCTTQTPYETSDVVHTGPLNPSHSAELATVKGEENADSSIGVHGRKTTVNLTASLQKNGPCFANQDSNISNAHGTSDGQSGSIHSTTVKSECKSPEKNDSLPMSVAPVSARIPSNPGTASATSDHAVKVETESTMQPPAVPSRRRILSVDLDPAGFDFEASMGVSWSSPACAPVAGNAESLPPIAQLPTSNVGVAVPAASSLPAVSHPNTVTSAAAAHVTTARDRGMSFELFSFAEEPLPPTSAVAAKMDASSNSTGRPRGDSIIFDPISFSDGGIHEETALKRTRHSSISMEDTDELEIMNSPGFVEAPASCLKPPSMAQQQLPPPPLTGKVSLDTKIPVPSPLVRTDTSVPSPLMPKTVNQAAHMPRNPMAAPASIPTACSNSAVQSANSKQAVIPQNESTTEHHQVGGKVATPLLPVGSSNPSSSIPISGTVATVPPASEKIINMPNGSAAAAAAAMAVPSPVVPSSLNGTAASHTACPMELLNKGGRIGIYLPEARKARIAKFHSKRKMRIWRKRIKYDCRKKLADSRPRIKGRFVKRSDMDEEE